MMTRITLLFGILLLLNSCMVYKISIESNVDKAEQLDLKKVNLVVEGSINSIKFLDSLSSIIARDLNRHGIEVQKTVKHPLELQSAEAFQKDYQAMLLNFQPDAIFTISEQHINNRYKYSELGRRTSVTTKYTEMTLDLEIKQQNSDKRLWRAAMKINSQGDFERLTKNSTQKTYLKIKEKLETDGILK